MVKISWLKRGPGPRDSFTPLAAVTRARGRKTQHAAVPDQSLLGLTAGHGTSYVGSTVLCGPGTGLGWALQGLGSYQDAKAVASGREGHARPLGWGFQEASLSPLPSGSSRGPAALPMGVGKWGGTAGGSPSLHTAGNYILVWQYSEKTVCVPKFLENRGQGGRFIRRPPGGGQSRPKVHQAAGKGGGKTRQAEQVASFPKGTMVCGEVLAGGPRSQFQGGEVMSGGRELGVRGGGT